MNKTITFLTVLMLAFATTNAQSNTPMKPDAGSFGMGFNITGLFNVAFANWANSSLGTQPLPDAGNTGLLPATVGALVPQQMLFGRYYLSQDLAIRAGLGINSTNAKFVTTDSTGLPDQIATTTNQLSAFSFGLNAGVEKHMATESKRLDPYVGGQISFAMLGKIKNVNTVESTTDLGALTETTDEWDGGLGFGIDVLGGFNYFFSDNFAIGAEMSWGFHTVSVGGTWTTMTTVSPNDPAVTPPADVMNTADAKVSVSGFSVGSTAGVNASIFF